MEELSYLEKSKLPYSLLLDAKTGLAAAYGNTHLPITERATAKLIAYALAHTGHTAAFDPALHAFGAPERRPLPDWATAEVQARLQVIWIERRNLTDEEWRAIPPR